jgi:hypothetical protein
MLLFPKRAVKTVAEGLIRRKGHMPIIEFVVLRPVEPSPAGPPHPWNRGAYRAS